MTNSIPSIDSLHTETESTKGLNNSFSDTQTTSTSPRGLFLEALVDAIDDKPLDSATQSHIMQNNIANVKLPSLSSLTSSIQNISNPNVLSQSIMDEYKYKDYMTAYTAYCQAYQYAATMAYHQQRAFANTFPRPYSHPINQVNNTNHRQLYPPIAIRPQDDPPFTGRYGHDDLVKAYSRTKPPINNQYIQNASNINSPIDDAHASSSNNMSDSENSDDQHDSINDEDSSDSMNMVSDGSMTTRESNQDIQRRTHKLAERKRRNEMKKLFEQLKTLLPNSTQSERHKLSKWDILSQTVNTIDSLIRKKALLTSKKNYLVPRVIKLQSVDNPSLIIDENINSVHISDLKGPEMRNDKKISCLDALAAIVNSP